MTAPTHPQWLARVGGSGMAHAFRADRDSTQPAYCGVERKAGDTWAPAGASRRCSTCVRVSEQELRSEARKGFTPGGAA